MALTVAGDRRAFAVVSRAAAAVAGAGEADATRIDIAARVDGRVAERPVSRGDNVAAGQLLVAIDNPELVMKLREAEAAKVVAAADLARIEVGTRAEVVASARPRSPRLKPA